MKGFRFKLEPVLALRRSQEEQLQRRLAETERALEQARTVLSDIAREMERQQARVAVSGRPGDLDMGGLLGATEYIAALRRRAEAQESVVAERRRVVNEARLALLVATTHRKGMERLREQQLALFEQEIVRKDQLGTEEMATQIYQRRGLGDTEVM